MRTNEGLCPNTECRETISTVKIEQINSINDNNKHNIRMLSYSCPNCKTVLSVQADPFAIMATIQKSIKKANR